MYNSESFVETIIPFFVVMASSIVFAFVYGKIKGYNQNKQIV